MKKHEFDRLYTVLIELWPQSIDVREKTLHENGGAAIPNLVSAHDAVEIKVEKLADFDAHLHGHIDWAIFTLLHQLARESDFVYPRETNREEVFRLCEEYKIANEKGERRKSSCGKETIMNEDKAAKAVSVAPYDKNISPVGWYVASYLLRFIELDREDIDDPEARFQAWENTILVKAKNLDEAYDKTVRIAMEGTKPYKGGPPPGTDVKWDFVGITELLPVYEEIKDGAEIMWGEHAPRKLKNLRKWVGGKDKFYR